MLQSGGVLVKGTTVVWTGSPQTWGTWSNSIELGNRWASYGEIYRQGTWVRIVIDKRAGCVARLPLKTYQRAARGRPEARDHPYAQLLRKPNTRHSRFFFWLWTATTYDIFGEAIWGKVRDRGGRPTQLLPLHPTAMRITDESDGELTWEFDNGKVRISGIPSSDLVHFRNYNPDDINRGLSKLESVRQTLENEDAARRATSSFWRNGARPGTVLTHPKTLSTPAADRVKVQWREMAEGADNTGKTVVLEEGMKPERLMLTAEEAQYIDGRKINREEFVAMYDMPPPAVHILDRATFSNIVEQMRSVYRDSMPPLLNAFEGDLEMQLRGSIRPGASEPDFGDDVYAEFLLDEVLRGDFEQRADAKQKAINSGQMTPAEAREMENLPFIEGSDRLFINSTMVPVDVAATAPEPNTVPVPEELDPATMRTLMGRLSRPKSLDEVDTAALVSGLNGHTDMVLARFYEARAAGEDVAGLRARLQSKE